MAVNLNPGADQTLVTAATRAAMANVPKDLSGTFESLAEEYGKTMREVGKSWAQVGKNLGSLAAPLVKKAVKELRTEFENLSTMTEKEIEVEGPQTEEDSGQPGYLLTPDTSDDPKPREKSTTKVSLGQELRDIRKELFGLFLKTDPESRARKAELRAKKDKYYSEIDILKQENNANNQLLASENVNLEATGALNLALNLGIKAYKTKGGKIKEGPYAGYSAVLSRNEDGDLSWMLKDRGGNYVTGMDGDQNLITTSGDKPYKVPLSEMSKTLTPKMDQKAVNDANKIIEGAFTSGKQGVDYMGNQLVNKFRPLLDNETSLQQLADVRLGDSPTTLREQFNNESVYSAEIFAGISGVELQSMGVVDADNDNDVDKDDIFPKGGLAGNANAVANFKAVRGAIFDKSNKNYNGGKYLKAVTEKHIYNTGEIMHGVGGRLYTPPKGSTITNPFGQKQIAFVPTEGSTVYKTPTQALADRDAILSGTRFTGVYGDYTPTEGGFNINNEFISTYDALVQEKVNLAGDRPGSGGPISTSVLDVVNDTSKKYGFGSGKQNVKSTSILSALKSFPGIELKTTNDLQTLLGKVQSDPEFKKQLIDHLNKQMGSNISTKFLDDMINDLIGNTKKKLK